MTDTVDLRLLFYNTFLLRAGRLPLPGPARYLHTKPVVDERARELGARLAGRYHVAALCEVFDQGERRAILAGWAPGRDRRVGTAARRWRHRPGTRPRTAIGPPILARRLPRLKSSGLFTIVSGHRLARTGTHLYRSRGHRFLDADAWAHKGALLVEVDVGLAANVEIYSTHLIWGGDLLFRRERGHRSAVADFRQAQSHELLDFVRRTHVPGNTTLIVGDFNIDAVDGSAAYGDLTAAMSDAGFVDLWLEHGTGPGYTCDARVLREAIAVADPQEPDLCLDPLDVAGLDGAGVDDAKRIDFAWLRRPSAVDGVTVDVRTVRRALFPRDPASPGFDEMPYLSDHLGLHLDLGIAGPGPSG